MKSWIASNWRLLRKQIRHLAISPLQLGIDLVLFICVLFSIFLLRSVVWEFRELKTTPATTALKKASSDTLGRALPDHFVAAKPQAMVLNNVIEIVGESADNIILSLSVNGRLTQVTLAKDGKFNFEQVPLQRGNNKIIVRAIAEDGSSAIIEELTTFCGSPTLNYLARSIDRGDLNQHQIALTFDGGAEDNVADEILDFLAQKHIRCTMFLTGAFINRHQELVLRMVQEGHEIGNHTWSHPHLTTYALNHRHDTLPEINRELIHAELSKTATLFEKVTGHKMAPLWRAPYGEHNLQIRQWAAEIGFRHVGWTMGYGNGESMDTMDWVSDPSAANYHSAEEILHKILRFGESNSQQANGSIVLMHLGSNRATDQVHKILPTLIDSLRARGYEMVTALKILE